MKDVIEFSDSDPLKTMQSFYIKDRSIGLTPNLIVVKNGQKWFETNSWGLKGKEPAPGKKVVVIWGDSVVFGMGSPTWPDLMNEHFDEYHFMNGGVEGSAVDHILQRAIRANGEHAIALNVIFPGWHPSGPSGSVNNTIERILREGMKQVPNAIVSTIPTSLNEEVIKLDLTPYRTGADGVVHFWGFGRNEPTTKMMEDFYTRIVERNEIIRRAAREAGVPLFDWFTAMRTTSVKDFAADFFDFGHPRISSYGKIAQVWSDALRRHLMAGTRSR